MSLTYPLAMPTSFGFAGFTIGIDFAVAVSESEFTFEQQVQEHQGTAWEITGNLNLLDRDDAEAYNAFLFALGGRKGTFTMAIPGSETPRGSAAATPGTPVVKGAGQTGTSLIIDGLPTSVTGYLKAGDFFQLGTGSTTRLHKLVEDADTNGSGEATLVFQPKIVTAPADNATVVVSNAKGLFRMKSNLQPVDIKPPNQHTINFSAREAR